MGGDVEEGEVRWRGVTVSGPELRERREIGLEY